MTIKEALDVQQRSVSYRDAEVLLQTVLECERAWLLAHPEEPLTPAQEALYLSFLNKREQNIPVAYITGQKEFYGRRFSCDARALIPRSETEALIDLAKQWLPKHFVTHLKETNKPCPVRILELGTGCGNIAITLALELTQLHIPCEVYATDISADALALATENWKHLKGSSPTPLTFLEADLFKHPMIEEKAPYDLIIANLPYVPLAWKQDPEAQPEVVFQEPDIALFGGEDGLELYRAFFKDAPQFLAPTGRVLIEYGEDETTAITPLFQTAFPEKHAKIHQDYAGLDRVIELS